MRNYKNVNTFCEKHPKFPGNRRPNFKCEKCLEFYKFNNPEKFTKTCNTCGFEKQLDEFYKLSEKRQNWGDGYLNQCIKCHNNHNKVLYQNLNEEEKRLILDRNIEYRKVHNDKIRLQNGARAHGYQITLEEFVSLKIYQENRCAICNKEFENLSKVQVDHCHETNQTRGLLCMFCNTGIGFLKDSIKNLENAISYLQNPPINQINKN